MKSVKEIEANRRSYHNDVMANSVHRASLLVPQMDNCKTSISFLNHFMVKRGYDNVACRITSVDKFGKRLECRLHKVEHPRVYNIDLTSECNAEAETYVVEFFASDNLFIPFPAVVINHVGSNFFNMVHAYNRVLNDVFENDSINANSVAEASLDVEIGPDTDTFLLFSAGQFDVNDDLIFELYAGGVSYREKIHVKLPRFGNRLMTLKNFVNDEVDGGILKIYPPKQAMFYGRIFSGRVKEDGSFSANHSFYDSSVVEEYWKNAQPSTRLYPFNSTLQNVVRIYPIMSPSKLEFFIRFYGHDGEDLGSFGIGSLESPSTDFIGVSVAEIAKKNAVSIDSISSFQLTASPLIGDTPTRINHQLVYGAGGLECSLNVSLTNPNIFSPPGKTYFSWGQIPLSEQLYSYLYLLTQAPVDTPCKISLSFYSTLGKAFSEEVVLKRGQCYSLKTEDLYERFGKPFVDAAPGSHWFSVESEGVAISAYTLAVHRESGHATGEHSF